MPSRTLVYSSSKAYTSANAKKYYAENTEKVKAYQARYREENREKCLAYQKEYREKKKRQSINEERDTSTVGSKAVEVSEGERREV
jgi:hypothetical protein